MKKLYFLFLLTIGFVSTAQIVNIPDANFKAKLLSASPSNQIASTQTPNYNYGIWSVTSYNSIDTNADGEIQVSEAQVVTWLFLEDSNIINLTGIEAFTNLKYLDCYDNSLQNLNISSLMNLQYLNCSLNQLLNLDVSMLTNIIDLQCYANQLVSLTVSNLLNLQNLNCSSNPLTSLDVSNLSNLKWLACAYNQLSSLDVSELINLQSLFIIQNQITSLNVLNLTNLQDLNCSSNQLIGLDISGLTNLQNLDCTWNQLTILNVSGCTSLQLLFCDNNQLLSLDASTLTNLEYLGCYNNNLTYVNIKNGNNSELDFSINNPNLQYICADEENIDWIQQILDANGYINCHVSSYCSFTPGGTFYEISGNTKFDSNNNGCEISDINYPNLNFSITDGTNTGSLIANQTGNFYIPVQAGNHTITPNLENPSYFNISPTSFTANFPTQASPFTQDFCVTANGVYHDVEVLLIQTIPARPGFDASYKLVFRNKGNQIENGSVSVTFDDARLDYVLANPVYDSAATNSFTWNYTNLQPFETREIALTLNVNSPMETPAVNNGDILHYTATIASTNTDETPTDNTFTLDQMVVNSYDPNDKTCLQGETIAPSEVGKYVHYVIRFENTGTFPAENIVVKDMIDLTKFDIATLVPLKSSHDFYTRIKDNKVEFIFENINLDFNDATNDGYVAFKIKTKPNLVLGDTFTNNANIYFDYNFPIITNTYTTTIAALSAQDFEFETYFSLYPNPAKDVLNIQTKYDLAVNSIEIYNQLGQVVMAITNFETKIDVTDLASGTYFVKLNTEKGSANSKFVKE